MMTVRGVLLWGLLCGALSFGAELPIRLVSWNLSPVEQSVVLPVQAGSQRVSSLFLQIHNLRFGGQVSVKVNEGDWTPLYNNSVELYEMEKRHDGIGGINATIRLDVPLRPNSVVRGAQNEVHFRLNGTDGVTTAVRILQVNFKDTSGARLVPTSAFSQEDPTLWRAPTPKPADIMKGEALWKGASKALINDPLSRSPLRASCSSCHFEDGSDLKYFNFSNETIIARSRFHGLSYREGEYIASYIRTRSSPAPAHPWDPPFQPGPGTDPLPSDSPQRQAKKAEEWLGGAGLSAVADDEGRIISALFPGGVNRAAVASVVDHDQTLSVREIPVPVQMPDWNMWLPDIAPEDGWANRADFEKPNALFQSTLARLREKPVTQLASAAQIHDIFGKFTRDLENWLGGYRVASVPIDTPTLRRRSAGLSREDVLQAISRWRAVKMVELVRQFDLEAVHDAQSVWRSRGRPKYTNERLSLPGITNRANVWQMAPHIIAGNTLNFEHQWKSTGMLESNQWYILQLIVNGANRTPAPGNVGVDWNYLYGHYRWANLHTGGLYSPTNMVSKLKQLQLRDTGVGVHNDGFSAAGLQPAFFFAETNGDPFFIQDGLDRFAPDLWKMVFEEYLHEWLDVVESIHPDDAVLMPRQSNNENYFEPKTTVPVPWDGSSDYFEKVDRAAMITQYYRLLPKMIEAGIDELLVEDFARCCQRIWPYNAGRWGGVKSWLANFPKPGLIRENFEQGSLFGGVERIRIKRAAGVNVPSVLKNGGGSFVASHSLADDAVEKRLTALTNRSLPAVAQNLTLRLRTGFEPRVMSTARDLTLEIGVRFDHDARLFYAPARSLPKSLFQRKYQSYDQQIAIPDGATSIVEIRLRWKKPRGASGGVVYLDNFSLTTGQNPSFSNDTTPPRAPNLGINRGLLAQSNRLPKIRLSWSKPPDSDVVGYNLYRWEEGEDQSTMKRVQDRLIRDPFRAINDGYARPGILYHYYVTAIDRAGNESSPSNRVTAQIPDSVTAKPPLIWSQVEEQGVRVGAIAALEPNVAHYRYFRKGSGDPSFTLLSRAVVGSESISYLDESVRPGESYTYYLEAVDQSGNTLRSEEVSIGQSPAAPSREMMGGAGVVAAYEPLQHFSALASLSVRQESEDRSVSEWRNLAADRWHARAVTGGIIFPSNSATPSGDRGLDLGTTRRGFEILSSQQQNDLFAFAPGGAASRKSGFTILLAAKVETLSAASKNPLFVNHGNASTPNAFGMRLSETGELQFFTQGKVVTKTGSRYEQGDTIILSYRYNAATGQYSWWDQKSGRVMGGNLTARWDFSSSQSLYLGTSANGGQFFQGTINELLVYDQSLSTSQLTALQNEATKRWMAEKPSLLATHRAENYDPAGSQTAYFDTTSQNIPNVYRTTEPVDIESSSEGGYHVSHIAAGESLQYTVQVPEQGEYDFFFDLASTQTTEKRFTLSCGNEPAGAELTFRPQGKGWQAWETYQLRNVSLAAGTQTLKVTFHTGGLNFNSFRVAKASVHSEGGIAPYTYEEWQRKWAGHVGLPEEDADQDGKSNLEEFAFGSHPLMAEQARDSNTPQFEFMASGIKVKHKILAGSTELQSRLELSETLERDDWSSVTPTVTRNNLGNLLFREVEYLLPRNRRRCFMRIAVELDQDAE